MTRVSTNSKKKSYKKYKGTSNSTYNVGNQRTSGFLGMERKFVDYEHAASIGTTLAGAEADPTTTNCISAVAQGDGENQRDGRKYEITDIMLKGYVNVAASTGQANPQGAILCRLAVVLDKQTNGAQFNAEDVFVDPSSTSLDTSCFRNLQYTSRFDVLWDKTLRLNPPGPEYNGTNYSHGEGQVPFEIYLKKKIMVNTVGTTATVASIQDNSVHVVALYKSANSATVALYYVSRCRFRG